MYSSRPIFCWLGRSYFFRQREQGTKQHSQINHVLDAVAIDITIHGMNKVFVMFQVNFGTSKRFQVISVEFMHIALLDHVIGHSTIAIDITIHEIKSLLFYQ